MDTEKEFSGKTVSPADGGSSSACGSIASGEKVRRYVDILSDAGFKAVFGEQRNSDVLIDLINVLLPPERKVMEISYMTTELPGFTPFSKSVRLDLRCRSHDGTVFIVEVQCYHQSNFFRRCVLYASKAYGSSSQRGDRQKYAIPPVYFIGLLSGGQSGPSDTEDRSDDIWNDRYISEYTFREKLSCRVPDETIFFIFAELERFGKRLDECRTMTEKWLYALKHVGTLDRLPESLRMQAFERLFEACEIAKFEPERKLTYEENMITEQDYYNIIDTAREDGKTEGLIEGETKGLARGRVEGLHEGRIEVAKSLKGLGVPFETIVKATGLSKREIEAL